MSGPKLCVVIVTWNSERDIAACLDSLQEQGIELQVVVVDNNSSDSTVATVRQRVGLQLVQNTTNQGFAAACNQGAKLCNAPWLLLLNPDTVVPPGTIKQWVDVAQQTPGMGASGPKLLNVDGSIQPSVRRLPTLATCLVLLLKLHKPFPALLRHYLYSDFDYSQPATVPQVMGAALLTPTSVYRQLGGLDERYHIWFEEVDYCSRLSAVGLKVWYLPQVSVTHAGAASFLQAGSLWRAWQFTRSLLRYTMTHR